MNFMNRALKNVGRRSTKSLLLIACFFLIGNLVLIGLGIYQATDNAKTLTRQKMQPVVQLELDYNTIFNHADKLETDEERNEFYRNLPTARYEDIKKMMQDEEIAAAEYSNTNYGYANSFTPVNNEKEGSDDNVMVTYSGGTGGIPDIKIKGTMFEGLMEFATGRYTLSEGRMLTQDDIDQRKNVVMIEEKLAELNNLKVGDTINLSTIDKEAREQFTDYINENDLDLELEIIGIFKDSQQVNENDPSMQYMPSSELSSNTLIMPLTTFAEYAAPIYTAEEQITAKTNPNFQVQSYTPESLYDGGNATFLLKNPLAIDDFVERYRDFGNEFLKFNTNNETFEALAKPLDSLSVFAKITVIAVVIVGIIIVSLITALTLKSRSYEIGILLSLGVAKIKVIGQLFIELAIVALIGFTLATVSGSLISTSIGDTVLKYQVDSEKTSQNQLEGSSFTIGGSQSYFTEISQEDLLSEYRVETSPSTILMLFTVGLAVVFISTLIPASSVMRYQPKKILGSID